MPEDSLNQLLNNYQNMSMEDLGKALLSRQATNRRLFTETTSIV